MAEDDAFEDDPVVAEVDVYLSKGLAEKLYLLQYPVRPSSMAYDDFEVTSARVKPKQQKFELEMSLDTRSPNYCHSKGEQIALNVDGMNKASGATYNSDVMDKQVLTSSHTASSVSRYCAGLLKDGELHLTPLQGIVQLRPSFKYLDKADVRVKQEKSADTEGESSQDEEEEAKPVMVKFARPETDQAKAKRLASWQYLEQKRSEEPWVDLNYHHIDDVASEVEYNQLYSQGNDFEVTEFGTSPKGYLAMLMPEEESSDIKMPQMPSNVLSMTQLKTMPLADQVRALLTSAKVLRFSQLLTLVSPVTDQTAVLRALQQVAVLVQGCWVVKSEVLYPKDSISANSGVSAEILSRGRDYIMWKFTQSRYVIRKEIAMVTRLPSEDIKEMLEQMSRMQVNQGWQFLIEYDSVFVSKFPEVVQRQQMLWDNKYQSLCKTLKLVNLKQRRKAKAENYHLMVCIVLDMTVSAVNIDFICGKERVKQAKVKAKAKLEQHPTTNADPAPVPMDTTPSSPPFDKKRLHKPVTVNNVTMNGPEIDTSNNEKLRTEVQNFVREKFLQQCILTISEMRRLLVSKLAACLPGHILASGVSDTLLEQCALEIGAKSLQLPWPTTLQVEDKRVFALGNHGDEYDKYREVMFDMYQYNFKYRRQQFTEKFQETLGTEPSSKSEFDKILKTCCVTRGAYWYLRGTMPST
ncbi:DNA-directed RNA polymerase III subunit RPC5-like [Ptychodera flava]|uniref:DNA-directed RNA polymerase III subunit RPC5-like n=1 Tax=Ptychodera flava TaxID=63121 RepID=UPI003969CAC7